MHRLAAFALFAVLALPACDSEYADAPSVFTYRTAGYDAGLDLEVAPNGDFVIVGIGDGQNAPTDGLLPYPLFLRARANGGQETLRVFDEGGASSFHALAPFLNGYAALFASEESRDRSVSVLPLDASGNPGLAVFTAEDAYPGDLIALDDGRLALLYTQFDGATPTVRLALVGEPGAPRVIDLPLDGADALALGRDGSLAVLGSGPGLQGPVLLLVEPATGAVRWTASLASIEGQPTGVAALGDGFVVSGTRYLVQTYGDDPTGPAAQTAVAVRIGAGGAVQWTRTYAEDALDTEATAVAVLPSGQIALARSERPVRTYGGDQVRVLVLDGTGQVQESPPVGPRGATNAIRTLKTLSDGRLAALGTTGPAGLSPRGVADFDVLLAVLPAQPVYHPAGD